MDKSNYLSIIIEEEYKLINELIENGKLKEYRYLIDMFDKEKQELIDMIDKTPKEIYNYIIQEYLKMVKGISLLTPNLTTGIKDAKSGVSIYTYDGKTKENGVSIDEDTRFDLASITKLFTAILALKLNEEGKFDLSKNVSEYDSKYNLNIPIREMIKFYYDLRTDGRLDDDISLKELKKRLYSTKIIEKNTFVYSDIPYIILKEILPNSDENFKKYFNEEMGLAHTNYGIPNDKKARVMEKYKLYPGHAGIFSTSRDLTKFFDALNNNFLSNSSIEDLITPIIDSPMLLNKDNIKRVSRAMGVYIKHPEGIRVSEITNVMSHEAFAITGFTGTYASFDLKNELTANILANPLYNENEREITINNEQFIIKDCGKTFENGTKFKVTGKTTSVLNNSEIIEKIPFTRITNTLKEGQIYTLLKLRLAKNILMRKSLEEKAEILNKNIKETFENPKIIKR